MRELWGADLETSSQSDKRGEIGIFEYPATGRFVNVGVPISQTILTEQERRDLPLIFADAGLDAGLPPPKSDLARILQEFGEGRLRPRTLRILHDPVAHKEEHDGSPEGLCWRNLRSGMVASQMKKKQKGLEESFPRRIVATLLGRNR